MKTAPSSQPMNPINLIMEHQIRMKMQTIMAHAAIAREMCRERGIGTIPGAIVADECRRRRIAALQQRDETTNEPLPAAPHRHGDHRDRVLDDATRDRRLREAMADLISKPARSTSVPIDAALRHGGVSDREAADPERWRICVHEGGHAIVANAMRPGGCESVRVEADGQSGACLFASTLPHLDDATVNAAGREAEYFFQLSPNTRLQDLYETSDGPQFLASITAHIEEVGGDMESVSLHAVERARGFINANTSAILGVAKLLFDHGKIDGETVRTVAEYHDGKYDALLRDRGIERR